MSAQPGCPELRGSLEERSTEACEGIPSITVAAAALAIDTPRLANSPAAEMAETREVTSNRCTLDIARRSLRSATIEPSVIGRIRRMKMGMGGYTFDRLELAPATYGNVSQHERRERATRQ